MKMRRTVLTLSAAVMVAACATRTGQSRIRVLGVDGLELEQIVPAGGGEPGESASARIEEMQAVEVVFQEIQAAVPMNWDSTVLVITKAKRGRSFKLALYKGGLSPWPDLEDVATVTPPTPGLYTAVEKLFEKIRALHMSPRSGYFRAERDQNGQMHGDVDYDYD